MLSHAQTLAGQRDDAQASARHALSIEPGNWRHNFRLALAAWRATNGSAR